MKICIVGAGYVGKAVGSGLQQKGHKIFYIELAKRTIDILKKENQEVYSPQEVKKTWIDSDITFFCTQTPNRNGRPDLRYLKAAVIDAAKRYAKIKKYHLFVIKSTIPPKTTENIIIPLIEKYAEKEVCKDFGICVNPEFLRQKSAIADFLHPKVILIGQKDKKSGRILKTIYKGFGCTIFHTSLNEAEMEKYLHNVFNAAKIAFFNELRIICKKSKIPSKRIFEICAKSAEGMWNPTYGTGDFGPFKGRCLPKDFEAFLEWTKRQKIKTPLLRAIYNENNNQ